MVGDLQQDRRNRLGHPDRNDVLMAIAEQSQAERECGQAAPATHQDEHAQRQSQPLADRVDYLVDLILQRQFGE